ncbi:MAG: hypothetical protein Q8Q92_04325 [bacterium]|nr:hypothetical protein [bacterium]
MTKNLHHANLLLGTPEEAEFYIYSLCKSLGVKLANNPDFFTFRMNTFGIDEARELSRLSARKAVTHRKIFLITPERLTLEAQNALLKTFEDPFPDTFFFLAVREEALVIPTLRSRMEICRIPKNLALESQDAEEFLSLSLKDRLLFAKKFIDEEKSLPVFLDSLLLLLRKQKQASKSVENVYNVRRFASDPAVSSRLIIEHLSLVLPG